MGCGFSSSSSGPGGALPPFSGVRVIHTNGYVEDFPAPAPGGGAVTVAHVTGTASPSAARYVLCSAAHLLQPGRGAFRPDDALQPGTVYFLLPHSVFQAESSAVDLACLMNRLTALAKKGCAAPVAPPLPPLPVEEGQQQKVVMPARAAKPCPWRPRLDRIDESIGRASSRSSTCSEA